MYITAQGKSFKGTPAAFARLNVFSAPAPFSHSGTLVGYDPLSRMLVWVDLPQMQVDGTTNGKTVQVIAPRRHGKTAVMKSIGMRQGGSQAGGRHRNGDLKRAKIEANDRKPEGKQGAGEWTRWGLAMGADFIVVSELPNLNMFHDDLKLSEAQIHSLAIKTGEFAANKVLDATSRWVMLVAARKMRAEFTKMTGTDTLAFVLSTMTAEDRDNYFLESDIKLMENHADVLVHSPELQEKIRAMRGGMLTPQTDMNRWEREAAQAEFLAASRQLTTFMGNAMEGEFGGVIGGARSPLEFLRQDRRVIDWTGTSRATQGILEFFFSEMGPLALKNPDLDIIPGTRFNDEDRTADSEIYLRTKLERYEKDRSLPTEEWDTLQFEKGRELTVGDAGSAKRGLAKLIDLGVAVRLLGKQPNNRAYLDDLGDTYNIPEHILNYSPRLKTGDWLVWTNGSREIRLIRHFMTAGELYVAASDSATEGKLDRANVINELGYIPAIASDDFIKWMLTERRSYNLNPQD